MLRSSRTTAALIRSLMLGTAAVTTTVAVSTVLVGCKNENEPGYWVDKLDDPKWRPNAVKRLGQFLDDALASSNGDMQGESVQKLLNEIVEPLTNSYVENYSDYDTNSRVALIKLLADFRDPRTEPALKKAFDEFAKRPRTTQDESDIKWAVRAYGRMKLEGLAPSVLAAFEKLEAHTQLGGVTYRDYSEAMVRAPSKQWAGPLIQMLNQPMTDPRSAKTKEQARDLVDPFRDQSFWQVTAAQVLGELREADAVEPLFKVLLEPSKSAVATTALLALVKIGKPSVDRALKVLDGSDTKLIDFHKEAVKKATEAKEAPSGNISLPVAAAVIGMAGRPEGIAPMIKILESDASDADKAVVARELEKIPATKESKDAFKKAFENIPLDASLQGMPALVALAEAAGQFYDADMIPWLLERARNTKGGGEEKVALQKTLVMTALKLAKPDQMASVKKAAETYNAKDLVANVEEVVNACGDKVDCYVSAIQKGDYQRKEKQLAGIKAGYMIGVLGNEAARDQLVGALGSIENAALRFVAAQTIDHLTPKGSDQVVTQLEEIIAKNKLSGDPNRMAADQPLQQVAYRLSVRGG